MARSIPTAVYNLAVYFGANAVSGSLPSPWFQAQLLSLSLPSGEILTPTWADIFLIAALVELLLDMIRLGRSRTKPLCHHSCMALLVICSSHLFLNHPGYGNSTFLLYVLLMVVEFVGGLAISLMVARRWGHALHVTDDTVR